jgi:hypothetical protein
LEPGPKPAFTRSDLVALVNTFSEVGFTKRLRLAILYRSDPHKRARLFSFLSALRGWQVSAFGDFEHALLWLSSSQETAAQPDQASPGKPVRIRTCSQETPGGQARACAVRSESRGLPSPRGKAPATLNVR